MKQKTEEERNWRIVKSRVCIRALFIFLGIILMQVLAYMLCVLGIMLYGLVTGQRTMEVLGSLAEANTGNGIFVISVSLVSSLLSGVWCGILYWRSDWRERPFQYRAALCGKNILAAVASGIGCCMFLQMLLTVIASLVPEAFGSYNQVMESLAGDTVITLLYVLLIGPVAEELIFRGAILDRFYLAFPFLAANVLQAVLFGVYHMNLIQGAYAFCLGLVLGLARYVSGSILVPALIHILFNAASYTMSALFPEEGALQAGFILFFTACGAALCFFGIRHWWRGYQKKVIS